MACAHAPPAGSRSGEARHAVRAEPAKQSDPVRKSCKGTASHPGRQTVNGIIRCLPVGADGKVTDVTVTGRRPSALKAISASSRLRLRAALRTGNRSRAMRGIDFTRAPGPDEAVG